MSIIVKGLNAPERCEYGHYECDVCYESVPHPTRYCPKCGSFMEGEE